MSYNGSGTFVVNSSGQPVVTGTVISSTAFNALTADLATGLSTAITKDGQTTTTARIVFAQGVSSTLVTDATSATTGSIITAGGISAQKALWVGTTTTLAGALTYGGVTLSNSVTGTGSMVLGTSPTISEPTCTSASANNCVILQRTGSSAGSARIYANSGDMFGCNDGTLYPFRVVQGATNNSLVVNTSNVAIGVALNYGGVTLSNAVTGTGNMVLSASPTLTGTLTAAAANFGGAVTISGTGALTITGVSGTPMSAITTQGTGTAGHSMQMRNTGAYGILEVASSTTSDFTGSSAYATILGTYNSTSLHFATNGAVRATLDTSGNLGIGGAAPAGVPLYVSASGAYVYLNSTTGGYSSLTGFDNGTQRWSIGQSGFGGGNGIQFFYGTTEGMRLDATGQFFVGVTTSWSQSRIDAKATGVANSYNAVSGWNSGSAGAAIIARVDNTAAYLIEFYYGASTSVGKITTNGTATTYNTASDARLKTNVSDAAPASALIDAIQVRQFDWKVDNSHQRYGMVAQELLEVAPEAVSAPADPEQMMGVDYSTLVPMLIKEVQSLRTRLAALENK